MGPGSEPVQCPQGTEAAELKQGARACYSRGWVRVFESWLRHHSLCQDMESLCEITFLSQRVKQQLIHESFKGKVTGTGGMFYQPRKGSPFPTRKFNTTVTPEELPQVEFKGTEWDHYTS